MDARSVKGSFFAIIAFLAVISNRVSHAFYISKWVIGVTSVVIGVILYFANAILTGHYIHTRAPEFWEPDKKIYGQYLWEYTSGTGIVPKWVSWMGLIGIAFIVVGIISFIIPGLLLVASLFLD